MDLAHHGTTAAQQSSAARLLTALTRSFLAQQAWASPFPDEFTLILRKKCVIAAALHVVAIPQTELENYLQFHNLHKSRLFRYFSINSADSAKAQLKASLLR